MKLLTEDLKKKIPALYSRESDADMRFVCKFFDPMGSWTWYVLEGEQLDNGDWRFYGLVDGFEKEWGYFMLSDLESVHANIDFHPGIERDIHFSNELVADYA